MNLLRRFRKWNLNRKQADLNKEWNRYGFSNELLEKQIKINEERFERNIPEGKEQDSSGEFVQ